MRKGLLVATFPILLLVTGAAWGQCVDQYDNVVPRAGCMISQSPCETANRCVVTASPIKSASAASIDVVPLQSRATISARHAKHSAEIAPFTRVASKVGGRPSTDVVLKRKGS